jgi:hypothetical protein
LTPINLLHHEVEAVKPIAYAKKKKVTRNKLRGKAKEETSKGLTLA